MRKHLIAASAITLTGRGIVGAHYGTALLGIGVCLLTLGAIYLCALWVKTIVSYGP